MLIQGSLRAIGAYEAGSHGGHSHSGPGGPEGAPGSGGGAAADGGARGGLQPLPEGHAPDLPQPPPLQPTFIASPNDDHMAPSVLVWTADFFDADMPPQQPLRIQAGDGGATLLVWGVDAATLVGENGGAAAGL